MKKINRRDFLIATGLCLVSGKELYGVIKKVNEPNRLKNIFQQIKDATILYDADLEFMGNKLKRQGHGVNQDGYLFTCRHITHQPKFYSTPFGIFEFDKKDIDEQKSEVSYKENKLERIMTDDVLDIEIYKVPEKLNVPKLPRQVGDSDCIYEGQEVYLVGDPHLEGFNIRKGIICDLNAPEKKDTTFGFGIGKTNFVVDKQIILGDSGTGVYDAQTFELLGISRSGYNKGMAYITKINEYKKCLKIGELANRISKK